MPENDLAVPCPYCGHHTLYRPEGWVEGGPAACANPMCDSNHPPTNDSLTCCCGRKLRHPEPTEGIDLEWVHEDGSAFCQESGWYDEKSGEWHDPDYATPRSD